MIVICIPAFVDKYFNISKVETEIQYLWSTWDIGWIIETQYVGMTPRYMEYIFIDL